MRTHTTTQTGAGNTTAARSITNQEAELFCSRRVQFQEMTKPALTPFVDNGIRIYGGNACAVLQLRGFGPINERGNGKPRRMIATASYLDKAEVRALIEKLQKIEATLH